MINLASTHTLLAGKPWERIVYLFIIRIPQHVRFLCHGHHAYAWPAIRLGGAHRRAMRGSRSATPAPPGRGHRNGRRQRNTPRGPGPDAYRPPGQAGARSNSEGGEAPAAGGLPRLLLCRAGTTARPVPAAKKAPRPWRYLGARACACYHEIAITAIQDAPNLIK